jgi:hypothetical protein
VLTERCHYITNSEVANSCSGPPFPAALPKRPPRPAKIAKRWPGYGSGSSV